MINKYNNSNELIVFWNNGIKKIEFINFILKLSIFFLFFHLFLNLLISAKFSRFSKKIYKKIKDRFFT